MAYLAKKTKRVIEVVDATQQLQGSDQTHLGATPYKRKMMAKASATELKAIETADNGTVEHKAKRQALIDKATNTDITEMRKEVMDVARAKMSKRDQHRMDDEKLRAIGGKIAKRPAIPRLQQEAQNRNELNAKIRYYERQKEAGLADGLHDPRIAQRKKMEEKYTKEVKSLKLHGVGRVGKDGTTLSLGKTAQKRTTQQTRTLKGGGKSLKSVFKW